MDEKKLESASSEPGQRNESIHISDVIEVIETDPDFKSSKMFNGGSEIPQQHPTRSRLFSGSAKRTNSMYVKILEQPAPKALRFRYECEGRSAGSIPGASSTPENKTYPAIQVVGYTGRAVVVVSCVTKDYPYRPHPHNLVGREGCKRGVCTMEIPPDTMIATFSNLGIQCVKKKDIESALRLREEIRVDPFRTGFNHRNQPTSIDLNTVRLCFQVFIEQGGKTTSPLLPVVSEPIYDKKAMSDLNIVKLSDCVSYVDGGRKDIILLCEKVAKEDIQVRFFEEKDGQTVWEGFADFQPSQVHKQHAIWFRTPRYRTLEITEPVKVFIQLRRPSDGITSESLPFEFLPLDSDPAVLKRKRQKTDDPNIFLQNLKEHSNSPTGYNFMQMQMDGIKSEPRDQTPSPYYMGGGVSPLYANSNSGHSPFSLSPMDMNFAEQNSPQQNTLNVPNYHIPVDLLSNTQSNWNIPGTSSGLTNHFNTFNNNVTTSNVVLNNFDAIPPESSNNIDPNVASIQNLDSQEIIEMASKVVHFPEINNLSLSDMNSEFA